MRRATRVVVVTGFIFAVMAGVAAWAVAQGAAKDDRAATVELMRTIVPKGAYDAMLEQMYAQMSSTMQQMGGQALPAKKQKSLKEAVQECLPYDDLLSWSADVYTKHFTRKEIDDLAAFYKTPTGKKLAASLPTLSGEIGTKMAPILMTRLPAALKKRGLE
jgi:uncharacterized protein